MAYGVWGSQKDRAAIDDILRSASSRPTAASVRRPKFSDGGSKGEIGKSLGGFIKGEIARGKRDAKVIKKAVIQPKVESILDKALKKSGLTGGFSDWMHWGDMGGRWGGNEGVPLNFPPGFGDTGARFLQPTSRHIIGQRQVQSPNHPYVLA